MPSLYAERLDISAWTAWRKELERLPEDLKRVGDGIVADEAKGMAAAVRQAYGRTFETRRGELTRGINAQQRRPMAWQVYNSWGTAHWFEYGTNIRVTRRQAVPAWRGRLRVEAAGGTIGGFTGEKATSRRKSTAVFRPLFIPLAIKHRRQMIERLAGLLERHGFTVQRAA
jgi:hypothetical protein